MKNKYKKYIFIALGTCIFSFAITTALSSCSNVVKFNASFNQNDDYYTQKGINPIEPEENMFNKYNSQTALKLLTSQKNIAERTKCAFQRWAFHSIENIWSLMGGDFDEYVINFSYSFNLKSLNLDFKSSWSNNTYECIYYFNNYHIGAAGWDDQAEEGKQARLILMPNGLNAEVVSKYKELDDTEWTIATNHNIFAIGGHSLDAIGTILP